MVYPLGKSTLSRTSSVPMMFPLWRSLSVCVTLSTAAVTTPALAQVTPDRTLNTQVEQQGQRFNITGGTAAGGNLFHSFSDFSIPQGSEAFFNHAPTLSNIISRVTGGNPSDIQGSIRSVGSANVFLINPAGIVFGESASLNVGGSFVGTTGDRLLFADGLTFEANPAIASPLLSMSVPAGLQTGRDPGSIINRSRTLNAMGEVRGLQVRPGQALVLVGGEVQLEGGFLNSPSGSVNVGSLASSGTVLFSPTAMGLSLDYSEGAEFGDITLTQQAGIDTSGPRSGAIALRGDVLRLTQGSTLSGVTIGALDSAPIALTGRQILLDGNSSIQSITTASGRSATITLQGSERVELIGGGYAIRLQAILSGISDQVPPVEAIDSVLTITTGSGRSGDVTIITPRLQLSNGASLGSNAIGSSGDAGDLIIRASAQLDAIGAFLGTASIDGATGNGGSVIIEAPQVRLRDGALISGTTSGGGRGGNISITADRVELSDSRTALPPIPPVRALRSLALTGLNSVTVGPGSAGDITITAAVVDFSAGANINIGSIDTFTELAGPSGNLTIRASDRFQMRGVSPQDGFPTFINTSTSTQAFAGDVVLEVGQLLLQDGATLQSGTLDDQSGGQVFVTATEGVEITGTGVSPFLQRLFPSSIASEALPSGEGRITTGNAGSITIVTPRLRVGNGGTIAVSSTSAGNAGNIDLTVDTLQLDQQGIITGSTLGGDGGQLLIRVRDRLSLAGQSEITSTAGVGAIGQSGNIQITAGNLVLKDSVISANSLSPASQGGDITLVIGDTFQSTNSRLEATTVSTNGGDIRLRADGGVILRNASSLSTTAGLAGQGGNGGNIRITSPVVAALPAENSDITANAFVGDGGNIQIDTNALLGLELRSALTAQSDITASSEFGVDGTIAINEFTLDPEDGLGLQTPPLIDPATQISRSCVVQEGQFIAVGRGGLVQDSRQHSQSDRPWDDIRDLSQFRSAATASAATENGTSSVIVEATGWSTAQGQTTLQAKLPSPEAFGQSPHCPSRG